MGEKKKVCHFHSLANNIFLLVIASFYSGFISYVNFLLVTKNVSVSYTTKSSLSLLSYFFPNPEIAFGTCFLIAFPTTPLSTFLSTGKVNATVYLINQ